MLSALEQIETVCELVRRRKARVQAAGARGFRIIRLRGSRWQALF